MQRWSLVTLTLTLAGVCGCAPGPRGGNNQADVDAINKVRNNEVASLAEGRTGEIMTVFTAIEHYNGVMAVTPKKGGPILEEHVRGIHVYRRQPDGSWRIAQDIWNAEPPASSR